MRNIARAVLAALVIASPASAAERPDDLATWRQFREALRSGAMEDSARYRPLRPELREPLMGFLREMRRQVKWEESRAEPEVFHVGDRVHYVAPLAFPQGDSTVTVPFCFTLTVDRGRWYFVHLQSIFLRLDRIGEPPVSRFPDLAEDRKAWIRDELQTSKDARLFAHLAREKGERFALDWFKDGQGYALQAQAWIPFVPPERAFVLYLCWDLANLRGEPVVLESLAEREARVRFTPRFPALFEQSAHLKQQIPLEDYRRLFEGVWQDRARSAGWNLTISYEAGECVFRLSR